MYYEVFLFTRDEKDYAWRIKPEYLQSDLYKKCKKIINLRDKYKEWGEEWRQLFFGFHYGENYIIARIITTNEMDPFRRPIFSLEGICIQQRHLKRAILEIPSIISHINKEKITIYNLYKENKKIQGINIETIINPFYKEEEGNLEEINTLDYFREHILNNRENFTFVYGKNVKEIYDFIAKEYRIQYYFDINEKYLTNINYKVDKEEKKKIVFLSQEEKRRTSLSICFKKNGKQSYIYQWILKDIYNSNLEYAVSDEYIIKQKIKINRLIEEGNAIKRYAKLIGWEVE